MKKIGIIGAGVSGLVLAYKLLQKGNEVIVFEKNSNIGGQLYAIPIESQITEIFYHHTFISDYNFIDLCKELDIQDTLKWYTSSMAYYIDNRLYPFGKPIDLLKFKPLGFIEKIKFGISIIHMQFFVDMEKLKNISAKDWFYQYGYSKVWDIIWEPLFRLKFADISNDISIVWLADKLHKRGKSRSKAVKEKLCYMDGSFFLLIEKLKEKIIEMGGVINTNSNVDIIENKNQKFLVKINKKKQIECDIIISTLSAERHKKIFSFNKNYNDYLLNYKYQSAICVMLVLKEKFTDYYWINIGDYSLPFGGIIEHSNLIGSEKYRGNAIIYISKYMDNNSDFYKYSNKKILSEFCKGLKKINNNFKEEHILEFHVFKEDAAQPIVKAKYNKPEFTTPEKGIYWLSTHHVYPHDRGIEYAVEQSIILAELIS